MLLPFLLFVLKALKRLRWYCLSNKHTIWLRLLCNIMSAPGKSNPSVHFAGNEPEPSARINTNVCLRTCKYINNKRTRTNAGTPEKHKHHQSFSWNASLSIASATDRLREDFSELLLRQTCCPRCLGCMCVHWKHVNTRFLRNKRTSSVFSNSYETGGSSLLHPLYYK